MPDPAGLAGLTDPERAALEAIDERYILDLLAELVAIPTVGGYEDAGQERMAREMRALGLEVDTWDIDLDELSRDPDYSAEVERATATGVVGTWGAGEPSLMINGHIDVVPVGDPALWHTPPWEATVRDGRIHGRGTADMKGGLVSALAAMRALRTAGAAPLRTILLTSVAAEEDGGAGTLATLRRGHSAAAAVVVEPTAGAIGPSQAGALGFRLIVRGRPAHGASRGEGVSAIEKFQILHDAIRVLEAERNAAFADPLYATYDLPLGISIGTLRAGEWASTVPDTAVAEGRFGVGPEEPVDAARQRLAAAIAGAAAEDDWLREHPPELEWWGGQFHPGVTPVDAAVVGEVAACHTVVTGAAPPILGVPYGSDLRHLVNRGGIPTVLYGPGDPRVAHRANEFVPVADVVRVARTLVLLMLRPTAR